MSTPRKKKNGLGEDKERKRGRKKKSIEDTEAWKIADWEYSGLIAQDMMPFLNPPLGGQERIDYLNEILKGCPEHYPTLIELGYRYIKKGRDEKGKVSIDKGLYSLKKYFSKKNLIDAYYDICEFLEKHFRFEMAIEYYNQLMELETDKAKVYDAMSYCYSYLGDVEKAIELEGKALALCDSNHRLYCNMGWLEMLRGNLNTAKTFLEKAMALNRQDEVTLNNYKICKLMISKGWKNWEFYLLRKTDHKYLEKLENEDNIEEYERQVRIYNRDKVEAFKFELARNPNYTSAEKYDIFFTLNYVFDLIWKSYESEYFFNDDIVWVRENFETIMHRVILKTGDIDEEIFNGVYTALLEFYKFLAKWKVVSEYKSLEKRMLELEPELMETMLKYNAIRHNDEYTEEEKDEIRRELFEEDFFYI